MAETNVAAIARAQTTNQFSQSQGRILFLNLRNASGLNERQASDATMPADDQILPETSSAITEGKCTKRRSPFGAFTQPLAGNQTYIKSLGFDQDPDTEDWVPRLNSRFKSSITFSSLKRLPPNRLAPDALITLVVLVGSMVLFISGWLAPEVTGLLVVGLLMATGVLQPGEALEGFGSPALLTVLGLFAISAGLFRSGGLDQLRGLIGSDAVRSPKRMILLLTTLVAPVFSLRAQHNRSWPPCCR